MEWNCSKNNLRNFPSAKGTLCAVFFTVYMLLVYICCLHTVYCNGDVSKRQDAIFWQSVVLQHCVDKSTGYGRPVFWEVSKGHSVDLETSVCCWYRRAAAAPLFDDCPPSFAKPQQHFQPNAFLPSCKRYLDFQNRMSD